MPSTKKYDAVATIGEYTTGKGETKKRYLNVGTVFENERGQLSLKLDGVPVGKEWSGWISFFEPKEQGRDRTAAEGRGERSARTPAHSSNQGSDWDNDQDSDSIPF